MNKVFQANNTTVPCRKKKKNWKSTHQNNEEPHSKQHIHEMSIIPPHPTPELPVLHTQGLQDFSLSPPSYVRFQTLNVHLFPQFIFSTSSSPRCSSMSILSVRGILFLLILAWPRFRMSSRTDFRFGCLCKNKTKHQILLTGRRYSGKSHPTCLRRGGKVTKMFRTVRRGAIISFD